MNQFLHIIYAAKTLYVLYSMEKHYPKAVAKAVQQQNKLIKDIWVVVIVEEYHEKLCLLLRSRSVPTMGSLQFLTQTGQTKWFVGMLLSMKVHSRLFTSYII
jgi:hypothetical protein